MFKYSVFVDSRLYNIEDDIINAFTAMLILQKRYPESRITITARNF